MCGGAGLWKKYVPGLEFLGHDVRGPLKLVKRRLGDEERVESDVRILTREVLLLLLDGLREMDLGIILVIEVVEAFEVYEGDVLPGILLHPEDEVRVEATSLEETDALAAAPVAQHVHLAPTQGRCVLRDEPREVLDEGALAPVEGDWGDLNAFAREVDDRHVQMPVERERLEHTHGLRGDRSQLRLRAQSVEGIANVLLSRRHAERVVLEEVPIVRLKLFVADVVLLLLGLAKAVVALDVLLEERDGDLLPDTNALEVGELKVSRGDE